MARKKPPIKDRVRTVTFCPRSSDASLDIQIRKDVAEQLFKDGKIVAYRDPPYGYGPKLDVLKDFPPPMYAPPFVRIHRIADEDAYNPQSSNPKHW